MKITTGDKILVGALLILNIGLFTVWGVGHARGDWVVIEVDRREVARLSLTENRHTSVEGPLGITEVEVKDGKVRILRSHCKGKVCIKSGYIQYADRMAVCLPNKVVVRILGASQRGVDTIVG